MKQYERFTIDEKIEMYLKTESHLLVWSKSEQTIDNSKTERQLSEVKNLLKVALADIAKLKESKS